MEKLGGFEFWRKKLKKARLIVAPMVDQSELPWRLLSRRYGAELCYSPMFHASVFVRDERYRREALVSCAQDRPLIIQFCANDPDILLKAALYAQDHCEAVDLNLGCPQSIAKRGHYGAFLQDEWHLLEKMVHTCHEKLSVPITCKIRVFEDIEKTKEYAKMLEKAGCQLLTVHGRTKEQKGPLTGIASWQHIKAVKEAVKIPVFANGNIQYLSDVERCLLETGVEGVMTAEGNLHNPALLSGSQPAVWDMSLEYLDLVDMYPCLMSYVRGHLFKLFHHILQVHSHLRYEIAHGKTVQDMRETSKKLRDASQSDIENYTKDPSSWKSDLPFPYWICQPFVRPNAEERAERQKVRKLKKRTHEVSDSDTANADSDTANGERLSKNKMKKRVRNPNKSFVPRPWLLHKCEKCGNPKGEKCVFALCRACCKNQCRQTMKDCPGHRLWIKTNQDKRQRYEEAEKRASGDSEVETASGKDADCLSQELKVTDSIPLCHKTENINDIDTEYIATPSCDTSENKIDKLCDNKPHDVPSGDSECTLTTVDDKRRLGVVESSSDLESNNVKDSVS